MKRLSYKYIFTISIVLGVAPAQQNLRMLNTDSLYADSLYRIGKEYWRNCDGDSALNYLEKSLDIWGKDNLLKQVSIAHNRIAMTYSECFGDWKKAKKHWSKTLEIKENLGDSIGIARVNHYLGQVHSQMDNYKKARASFSKSLESSEKFKINRLTLMNLNALGLLEKEQERYYFAEKHFKKILAMIDESEDNIKAIVLNNLGYLAFSKGQFGKAHEYFIQSINVYGDLFPKKEKAILSMNLGMAFAAYNDTVSARIHYYKALELAEDHKQIKASVYNNLGIYYKGQKQFDKGIDFFMRSISLKEEIGDTKGLINTLTNMGDLFHSRGDRQKAREIYKEARKKSQDLGYIHGETQSLYNLGTLELDEKKYDISLKIYQEGIQIAETLENDYFGYLFNEGIGDVYSAQGELIRSVKFYKTSIEHAENIRKGIGLEGHRSSFMAGVMDVYRKLANIQIGLNKSETAYHTYERMKARNLLDILDGAFLVFEDEMTQEEIEKEQIMESRLRYVNKEISEFTLLDGTTRGLDSLTRVIQNARRSMDRFKSKLYFNHPELKQKMGHGEPIRTRDAVKLLNLNEAAIAYMVGEDNTICFVLKKMGRRKFSVKSFSLEITREEINNKTTALRKHWGSGTSRWLYEKLIGPIKDELSGISQLCIISDSYLHNLPFHALKSGESNQYLLEEFVIYYVNSLSALDELRSIGTAGKERLLALGNPDFGESGVATIRNEYYTLPATEDEVNSLGELFGERALILTGEQAKEANFKSRAVDFGIIHLATHGVMDQLNPMYSAILLSSDEENDGFLTAREILKTELNADLVVLSACETASGKLTEGEGLMGLSRAFFGAEVPALVATLWPVGDKSTRILMERFYLEMEDGVRPAKALRNAQLSLLEQQAYRHPRSWAPFIFMGDTE